MHYKLSTRDGNVYLVSVDPFDTYEDTLPDMIKHNELPRLTETDSFTDEEAAQKEEIGITLYLNNDSFSQAVIKLYRYDGNTCLAYVDGKPVALIPRSQAVSLIEAVNTIVLGDKTSEN